MPFKPVAMYAITERGGVRGVRKGIFSSLAGDLGDIMDKTGAEMKQQVTDFILWGVCSMVVQQQPHVEAAANRY